MVFGMLGRPARFPSTHQFDVWGDFWVVATAVPAIDAFAGVGEAVVVKLAVGVLAIVRSAHLVEDAETLPIGRERKRAGDSGDLLRTSAFTVVLAARADTS
jgi:hypothetical protein